MRIIGWVPKDECEDDSPKELLVSLTQNDVDGLFDTYYSVIDESEEVKHIIYQLEDVTNEDEKNQKIPRSHPIKWENLYEVDTELITLPD